MPRRAVPVVLLAFAAAYGCVKREEDTAAYKAACDGPPLRTVERRNKAMEDGLNINRRFDCIESKAVVAAREARMRAETEVELKAQAERRAELDRKLQEEAAKRAAEAPPPLPPFVMRDVEINTASEADLLPIPGISRETAADIVALRAKEGRYAHWPDVVRRVTGLSAARNALFASMCGLRVNGEPLEQLPFDAATTKEMCLRARRDS